MEYRQSALKDYFLCPRLYYYRWDRDVQIPYTRYSKAAVIGNALHAYLATEDRLNEDAFLEAFASRIPAEVFDLWGKDKYVEANREAWEILSHSFPSILMKQDEWRTEPDIGREIEVKFSYGSNDFHGRIDAIWEDGSDVYVVDFKSGDPKLRGNTQFDFQLQFYAFGLQASGTCHPTHIVHCYLRDFVPWKVTRGRCVKGERRGKGFYVSEWNESASNMFQERLTGLVSGIEKKHFFPRDGKYCFMCAFQEVCQSGVSIKDFESVEKDKLPPEIQKELNEEMRRYTE